MYVVTVEFEIASERIDAFRIAMRKQAAMSLQNEEACRQFDVCLDPDQSRLIFLYELYDDRSAFEKHLASDHFREFDALVSDMVVSKRVKTWVQDSIVEF